MLKFTYTETDVQLERLTLSPEKLVARRVTLAMRVGQCLCVEPSQASFLLPRHLSEVAQLEAVVRALGSEIVSLCVADAEFLEVSVQGTWVAADLNTADGMFVTALSSACEQLIFQLWQEARVDASCLQD